MHGDPLRITRDAVEEQAAPISLRPFDGAPTARDRASAALSFSPIWRLISPGSGNVSNARSSMPGSASVLARTPSATTVARLVRLLDGLL